MFWHKLLNEILIRENQNKELFTSFINQNGSYQLQVLKPQKQNYIFQLSSNYKNIYFTAREAQCMLYILKGYTFNDIGNKLALSARTVEYYVKNMKKKVGCKTKYQLIDLILSSDFLQKNNSNANLQKLMP